MLKIKPYGHTHSNPIRKHSQEVHLREEQIILILISNKSAQVIFLLKVT